MSYEYIAQRAREILLAPGSDFRTVTATRKDGSEFTKQTSAAHTRAALKPEVDAKRSAIATRTQKENPMLIFLGNAHPSDPNRKGFSVDVRRLKRIAANGEVWDIENGRMYRRAKGETVNHV